MPAVSIILSIFSLQPAACERKSMTEARLRVVEPDDICKLEPAISRILRQRRAMPVLLVLHRRKTLRYLSACCRASAYQYGDRRITQTHRVSQRFFAGSTPFWYRLAVATNRFHPSAGFPAVQLRSTVARGGKCESNGFSGIWHRVKRKARSQHLQVNGWVLVSRETRQTGTLPSFLACLQRFRAPFSG